MNAERRLQIESAAALALLHAIAETIGDDAKARLDMVEGSTNLLEAIDQTISRINNLKSHRDGIKSEIDRLRARFKRLEEADERLRLLLRQALENVGERKIERPTATVSVVHIPPSVVVHAETELPDEFWRQPPRVIDKIKIAFELRNGREVPGASLSNGDVTVAIR